MAQDNQQNYKNTPVKHNITIWRRKFFRRFTSPETYWFTLGTVFSVVLITSFGWVALSSARIPYFAISPGNVHSVTSAIEISEANNFPTYYDDSEGEFGYVTARVTSELNPLNWVVYNLDPDSRIIHTKVFGPEAPEAEVRQNISIQEIRNSQATAVLVALDKLGIEVIEKYLGLRVFAIEECADAYNSLMVGDIIIAINGAQTLEFGELTMALTNKKPGDVISVTVDRNGQIIEELDIVLGAADDACLGSFFEENSDTEATNRAAIGISTAQIVELEYPVEVEFDTGRVGGSSAGLAFTLGLLDVLEPGDLSGGNRVAATGSIQIDGTVTKIGGVQEKLKAVQRQGYNIFFVPNEQLRLVENDGGDVEIIGIDTLDEALEALEQRGGDPLDSYSLELQPQAGEEI